MDDCRVRVCLCYLATGAVMTLFLTFMIFNNGSNNAAITKLQDEVTDMAHVIFESGPPIDSGQNKLAETVDKVLKQRLEGFWKDVTKLRNQVQTLQITSAAAAPMKSEKAQLALAGKTDGRVNFASEDLGAKIFHVHAKPVTKSNFFKNLLGLEFSNNPPIFMLRDNMEPGNCFGFRENKSEVTIKLARDILIETVEVEHVAKNLSPSGDVTSAPKNFRIYGVDKHSCDGESLLGNFQYDNSPDKRIQTYPIKGEARFNLIRIKFDTNHGHPDFTCVYRVAVFGKIK